MYDKLTSTKGIALALTALLALSITTPAAAVVLDEQTVSVEDPDAEQIEATVELVDDPATSNTTLELVNDTSGGTVQTVDLNGSAGDTVTETMTVDSSGNYTVSITADSTDNATVQSVEVTNSMTGLFGSTSKDQQCAMFGVIGALAVGGVLAYREYENDDY